MAITPPAFHPNGLRFQFPDCRMDRGKKVCIGSLADQFMVIVRNCDFGMIQMPLMREDYASLCLALPVIE